MFNLPDEIILEIWDYSHSNSEMICFRQVCSRFKKIGDKYGYIRCLHLSMNSNYMNLMHIWSKIKLKSLRSLHVDGLNKPTTWIPIKWPREIILTQCNMSKDKLSPPPGSKVEIIRITDSVSSTIYIDWEKFPDLKILELNSLNVNLSGIEHCLSLEKVCIILNPRNTFPKYIADLKQLSFLVSNLVPTSPLHFISKKLRVCLVPKKRTSKGYERFTSNSTIVPVHHLTNNIKYVSPILFNI